MHFIPARRGTCVENDESIPTCRENKKNTLKGRFLMSSEHSTAPPRFQKGKKKRGRGIGVGESVGSGGFSDGLKRILRNGL